LNSEIIRHAPRERWGALFERSWHESRQRFLWALIGLSTLVAFVVLTSPGFRQGEAIQYPEHLVTGYTEYIWLALFNYYFQGFWIAAAVLLSFGGLRREKTMGTISFTLSLPIERSELLLSRLLVGIAEILALGIGPALLVPALSHAVHEHYPIGQIVLFALLMVVAGVVFFCFGFLLSSVFGGEFIGPVVGLCLVGTYFFVVRAKSLHWLSVLDTMSGEDAVSRSGNYFVGGSIPWSGILYSLGVSLVLYLCALRISQHHDF
jgi:ABC-type transport system involved in multi-copper enzyme maturation permease subunit